VSQQSTGGFLIATGIIFCGIFLAFDHTLNQPAPNFSLQEIYGSRVDLANYRGRSVLLVFWTTSCGICRRELPMLSRLRPELGNKGVSILAIHLGDREDARDYLRSNHIDLTAVADPEYVAGRAYHVSGVPKLVLIDGDGRIRRSSSGWLGADAVRNWVAEN